MTVRKTCRIERIALQRYGKVFAYQPTGADARARRLSSAIISHPHVVR